MNMLSFYGGPAGKDFTIAKVFPNKAAMDADVALGNDSTIYAGDYVLISYGDPNQPEFETNLTADGNASYNATLWKKEWNNGYSYREIVSIASSYPKFAAGNIESNLPFGSAPQLTVDSSSPANPKIGLKMPASLVAGTANTTESVAPTIAPSITPVYGGTLGSELSFQTKIPRGVTFIPSVSDDGIISWTNDGNLPEPMKKSIKGQKGDPGAISTVTATVDNTSIETGDPTCVVTAGGTPEKRSFNLAFNHLVGKQGIQGERGYYFTPEVSATGDLSWTSNGDLDSPATVNIKGPKGDGGTIQITSITVDNGSSETAAPSVEVVSGTTDPQHAKYSLSFHNLVGKRGPQGPRGYYFLPSLASNGDLSWTNNSGGELASPTTVNIRGPQGPIGNPLNIIATETITSAQVAEDTLMAVGAELTARGRNPQAGELIAVTYKKAEDSAVSYWYFKIDAAWQRVQLSGGMGGAIVNTKVEDATASSKVYSAEYINALEAKLAILENALTIGAIGRD